MAGTGKKEYTLKINGVAQNIKDVTNLETALNKLDGTLNKTRATEVKVNTAKKETTKALTEEEKAAKKLADTQARIAAANTEANRAQVAANQELRERNREVARSVAINQLAEGSIREMGMTLTDLRNEYESLSAAQRADEAQGGRLIEQIQALDAEYKALRESTGNFRDSVGNYEKGFKGLNELKDKFELAARGSVNLASDVAGSNDVLDAFGATTDTVAKSSEQLAGVMALAGVAQEAYNAVVKEGIIQEKAMAIVEGVRTIQLKAKTAAEALSTKGTIAATAAQWLLNAAAYANPYVLLALALAAVVGALYAFASSTDEAAEKQTELNALQSVFLDLLDQEAQKIKEAGEARVFQADTELKILQARGAKTEDIRKAENTLFIERSKNNAALRGFYGQEIDDLEKNRQKVEQLREVLAKLNTEKAKGEDKVKLDIDLDGKIDKVKVDDAITAVQGAIDNAQRTVKIAVDIQTERKELEAEAKITAATRLKADQDLAKERADRAKQAAATELAVTRANEDARIALIENSNDRQRRTIEVQAKRAIEDIKIRLATEKDLTEKARKALASNIKAIELQAAKDLKALRDEIASKDLEAQRQAEDSRTALIMGSTERQRAVINIQYARQVEDLKKRLATEKDLTATQQKAITEEIVNAQATRARELEALEAADLEKRTNQQLTAIDLMLTKSQNKIGDLVKRNKDGLKLIDVAGTRKNLAEANQVLDQYISNLVTYENDLKRAHEATLSALKAGTPEYIDEVLKYAAAHEDVAKRIKTAEKEQADNTRTSNNAQMDRYKELAGAVAEYAQVAVDAIGGVMDTFSMGLQVQIDDLTTQLEVINEQYEKAQAQRETAVKNVEDIEAQLQAATGGTATALKSQLADAMAARNEAAREEQRLAKEKEKREAEIAKKEKAIKRQDLISNIAGAIANTAQGVTKALSLIFPLNLIVAGLVGAMGAVQVGIMTKQLTKLAKGGEIKGPSHANGGVNIGLGYEAEGGEFMVNKTSYAANPDLVKFINDTPGQITAADLLGVVPTDNTPIVLDNGQNDSERLIEAISEMEFRPVVAVTDIIDVMDEVTTVRDLADF